MEANRAVGQTRGSNKGQYVEKEVERRDRTERAGQKQAEFLDKGTHAVFKG
jgi:hypothetical protein